MPVWNRRHFVQACLGGLAALPLARVRALPGGAPACRLSAEQTEGPYYLDRALLRQDITEGKQGLPLTLEFEVLDSRSCRPLKDVALEIWHCDAQGAYSGFGHDHGGGPGGGPGMPPPPPGPPPRGAMPPGGPRPGDGHPPHAQASDALTFLRGAQLADARGKLAFHTIFPGYYAGRCNHIHLKLHVGGMAQDGHYRGGHTVHTGQVFFREEDTRAAMATAPYRRERLARTTVDQDDIYASQHGAQSVAAITRDHQQGPWRARLTLAIDPGQTSREGS